MKSSRGLKAFRRPKVACQLRTWQQAVSRPREGPEIQAGTVQSGRQVKRVGLKDVANPPRQDGSIPSSLRSLLQQRSRRMRPGNPRQGLMVRDARKSALLT